MNLIHQSGKMGRWHAYYVVHQQEIDACRAAINDSNPIHAPSHKPHAYALGFQLAACMEEICHVTLGDESAYLSSMSVMFLRGVPVLSLCRGEVSSTDDNGVKKCKVSISSLVEQETQTGASALLYARHISPFCYASLDSIESLTEDRDPLVSSHIQFNAGDAARFRSATIPNADHDIQTGKIHYANTYMPQQRSIPPLYLVGLLTKPLLEFYNRTSDLGASVAEARKSMPHGMPFVKTFNFRMFRNAHTLAHDDLITYAIGNPTINMERMEARFPAWATNNGHALLFDGQIRLKFVQNLQ